MVERGKQPDSDDNAEPGCFFEIPSIGKFSVLRYIRDYQTLNWRSLE